ncbi:DUF1735 domain-containing protein [Mucilaginibacter ginsenosidivorax]|uniref:DUF1735 domain-containing protein n=1 Tax=Mucilaginibacter ginsenosidivorax TaxID=862126 RepID=A0A5B8VZM8_9SPHI|nr:DUF1735 domain-containing protein [Mucilaginibacter ginsenosidivorax]QEC76006.1 DUF1735 domain-containing protein [Mucilaginibacter ginsenosidivorax]
MKRNKFLNHILLACSVLVMFSACRKVPAGDLSNENSTAGKSYIGFTGDMESATFFDPFTDVKTISVFSVKKDAAKPADLTKGQTIVVTALPGAIDAYNEANDASYELLPASFYTLANSNATQAADGSLTFNFAPGDFQKEFAIKLDGSKLDLSKSYALAYKITKSDDLAVHAASKDTLYAFYSVKNKYDGVYTLAGNIKRYTSKTDLDPDLSGDFPDGQESKVATIAANANTFEIFWHTGGGVGGVAGLQLAVDASNKVTVTASGNPKLHNTAGIDNYYDPATKTFHLAFDWGADENSKRAVVATLTYKGAR